MVRRLSSELPEKFLRAVPTDFALQGYGKHWGSNASRPSDFHLSQATQHIDDFVSHDWRTPRVLKYITLSYIYNSRAAFIGSTVVSVLVALLRELLRFSGLLEDICERRPLVCDWGVCLTIGPVAYLILLFHWQTIRAAAGVSRNRLLFVDKLCIAQHDEEMKVQAIRGLAAFLKKSQRMVVLWSPAYFSRLWCTYELAAWFRFERLLSSVLFVPVEIPPTVVIALLGTSVACIGLHIEVIRYSLTPLVGLSIMASMPMAAYFFQSHVAHVAELRQQLKHFSIQESSCFCCSSGHADPSTGAPLPCDREMVYRMLRRWGTSDNLLLDDDACLSEFNDQVRTTLRYHVTTVLPERRLFIRYVDLVNMFTPLLWLSIDNTIYRLRHEPDAVTVILFLEGLVAWFLTNPLALVCFNRLLYLAKPSRDFVRGSILRQVLLSCFLWGPVEFVLTLGLWYCVRIQLYLALTGDTVLAICAWSVAVSMMAALVYYVFSRTGSVAEFESKKFSLSPKSRVSDQTGDTTVSKHATIEGRCSDIKVVEVHVNADNGCAGLEESLAFDVRAEDRYVDVKAVQRQVCAATRFEHLPQPSGEEKMQTTHIEPPHPRQISTASTAQLDDETISI
eukprot:TRINITY_DN13503_c1_g2_i1.p1 TRINITY_DN13503_c1_g2~~TRINITY_DN13503_c1_g2_i1.p1  ORF type:complete len:620 (+),score=39.35 TRINITY_DN13503_c1_g2_i1:84-1943(+)